jgi:membrane protease YdiL (CAAX protease family)
VASAGLGGAVFVPLLVLARPWARSHGADVAAITLAVLYLALLLALAACFGGPAGLRDRLGFRFTRVGDVTAALLLWVVTLVAGAVLSSLLVPLLGAPRSNAVPILSQSFDPIFAGLIVATVVVLAPAAEELLFRGALLGWLRGRLPLAAAAPLSAAVFAGAHVIPSLFPLLFLFGISAALVRERTGSTFNTFVMHMTQNAMAVVVTYALIASGRA